MVGVPAQTNEALKKVILWDTNTSLWGENPEGSFWVMTKAGATETEPDRQAWPGSRRGIRSGCAQLFPQPDTTFLPKCWRWWEAEVRGTARTWQKLYHEELPWKKLFTARSSRVRVNKWGPGGWGGPGGTWLQAWQRETWLHCSTSDGDYKHRSANRKTRRQHCSLYELSMFSAGNSKCQRGIWSLKQDGQNYD